MRETTGQRKQSKKRSASESTSSESHKEPRLEVVNVDALKIHFKDDIEFLNNCPNSEVSAILDRMKRTFSLRKAIIQSNQIPVLWNTFPCYLTTPNIVSFS